ncbi:hypothetical protein ACQCVH_22080 [Bacillus infantis]|uniref:hypothetical protein n=1 Tax=Bacillus infantis TaxID=324767 RepID=UPI003CFB781D
MLFSPTILLAGAATIGLAALDKTLSDFGFHGLNTALRLLIPIAAFAAGIYFLETNPLIHWIKL